MIRKYFVLAFLFVFLALFASIIRAQTSQNSVIKINDLSETIPISQSQLLTEPLNDSNKIEINSNDISVIQKKIPCFSPCSEINEVCNCPTTPTLNCQSPCEIHGDVCSCPSDNTKTCKIGCVCEKDRSECPIEKPACNYPCKINDSVCVCPSLTRRTCPIGCLCNGEITTCTITGVKPIEATINSINYGVSKVSIEKSAQYLTIRTDKGVASTSEKLVIEKEKLSLKTLSGDKEIRLSPEDASNKAQAADPNFISLSSIQDVPVYTVTQIQQKKLIFIVPVSYKIITEVDAQTGQIIKVNKPWWTILAK